MPLIPPFRSSPRLAAAACAALALGSAAFATPAAPARQEPFEWSGRLPAGATLRVFSVRGEIDVEPSPDGAVHVRALPRAGDDGERIRFEMQREEEGVTVCALWEGRSTCGPEGIRTGGGGRRNGWNGGQGSRADFTVQLPRGVALRVATGHGDVEVEGATADVQASSGNGEVRVGPGAGRVRVSSGNGDIRVEGARAPVSASSGNGRVVVSTAAGPVDASTGNGNIEARMGSLRTGEDMTFRSGNGSIVLVLPEDFAGELDGSTGNGALESEFPLLARGRLGGGRFQGTIGAGGRRVRLSTGNGNLVLRRATR